MHSQMQPLTQKELGYIADSLTNESLLIKECLTAASQTQNHSVQTLCSQLADRHMQHYAHLMSVMQQHQQMAPAQLQ